MVDAFSLPGSRPLGCLLVHGFTGTPEEMRPLAETLAAHGFPVHAVRLAGHGTDVTELARTRWSDWFASVEAGVAHLRATAGRLAVAGMSMGSLLALHLAATRPADVTALVLCGTPLRLGDARVRWVPLISRLLPTRLAMIAKANGPDVADPAMRAASLSYRMTPLAGVAQLLRLQVTVRAELPRVTQPALLLHGRHDHSVPLVNLELLHRSLGSPWIETGILERSWHVITMDVDRAEVGRLAADFLERVEAAPAAVRAPA